MSTLAKQLTEAAVTHLTAQGHLAQDLPEEEILPMPFNDESLFFLRHQPRAKPILNSLEDHYQYFGYL